MRRVLPEAKFENKWTLFFDFFLFERPLLTRDWKSESVTYGLTNFTYLLTGVGYRNPCVSINLKSVQIMLHKVKFLDTQVSLAPTHVSKLVGWLVRPLVRHTFGFPISGQ